jgi:hypothetical protein
MMNVGVMYSGVGGPNGADYVAEYLMNGFRKAGAAVTVIGKHGSYNPADITIPDGLDFVVHSSGFNLSLQLIARIREKTKLVLWTHNDEINWWADRIAPISKLVDIHYSYTKAHKYGDHVRYMPLAGDDEVYFPIPGTVKKYVVCLVGSIRRYRKEFTDGLLKIFPNSCFSYSMCLPFAEVNKLYNESRIVVGPVQDCDEDVPGRAWGCPCRTFDVPMSGALHVQVNRGGLADVFPKTLCVMPIKEPLEAVKIWALIIKELLEDENKRHQLAWIDYIQARTKHTYMHRAIQMMQDVRGLV